MAVDYESIGRRIKRYRMDKKLSQEELGQEILTSSVHISYVESGSRKLSLELLVSIANALDVSADDLLTDNLKHSSSPVRPLTQRSTTFSSTATMTRRRFSQGR